MGRKLESYESQKLLTALPARPPDQLRQAAVAEFQIWKTDYPKGLQLESECTKSFDFIHIA